MAEQRMSAAEYRAKAKEPARKYRNEPVVLDGLRFDSKRESIRWHVLRLMEKSGDIKNLKRQVRYPLLVGEVKIGEYWADFDYVDCQTKELITEDVKSPATQKIPLFQWKRKHFEAQYGRRIRITG